MEQIINNSGVISTEENKNIFTSVDIVNAENEVKPLYDKYELNPFIEANTTEVSLSCLQEDCIIPVFAKDNEKTISHQEFVSTVLDCVKGVFRAEVINMPEIRVSHQIKGRVPAAIHKSVKDLLDNEKTQYFERMAFIIRIPSISQEINGNELCLTVGGVRAYNNENLYGKKSLEKFKFFIGFQNMVCCNLCISTDGFMSEVKVANLCELKEKVLDVIDCFNLENNFSLLKSLNESYLTEHQFAQFIGKTRLYNHLSKSQKDGLPSLELNDGQLNTIARDYYQDKRFCVDEGKKISLWNVYNLLTSANKSSYVDTVLDRNVNALEFSLGLAKAINGSSNYHWFLS